MKDYENCYRLYLPKRQSIIVRCDMRAGHSFTKGFNRPYDALFAKCMWETAKQLCENISGCVFGYTQSDEISLVLVDYKNINTEPWFGNNLQKIVSISASMATHFFNEEFRREVFRESVNYKNWGSNNETPHMKALNSRFAFFDARAFILPREEVSNYIYWRMLDCTRNSIQLTGQAYFSHNQLQGLSCNEIQEKLFKEKDMNWAKLPNWFKNGVAIYREPTEIICPNGSTIVRGKWKIDLEMPIISKNPEYINKYVIF